VDSLHAGEGRAEAVGKRTVMPSSFIGGPRDMRYRYMDAMALVQRFGKLDIFLITQTRMRSSVNSTLAKHHNIVQISLFGSSKQNRKS
jgi:hypothetical protein